MSDERLRRSYDMLLSVRAESTGDRTQCPQVEQLQSLVRKEYDEERRLTLLDHVMACPFCQPEFELLRAVERGGS